MFLFGSKSSKQALCFSSTKHFQSPYHKTQYQIIIRNPFSYQANVVNLEHKLHHPDIMLQAQPLISVIVPVYKAEAYLHRCVDSLVAQTLKNIEILLINDGSPDQSGAICDEYAQRYPFIKVFHNKNQGVSATRQFGIDHASGIYSIHTDPDDWVEPTMLEDLYNKAQETNADMVIFDFIAEYKNKSKYCKQQPSDYAPNKVLKEMFTVLHGSCVNKLIRHSCYKEYNVSFPIGFSCFEDLYTTVSLLRNNIKVAYIPKAYYHYDKSINTNSIIKHYTLKSCEEDLYMFKAFSELAKTLGDAKDVCLQTLASLLVARAFNSGIFSSKEFRANFEFAIPYIQANPRIKAFRKWKFCMACKGYYSIIYLPQRIAKDFKQCLKQL